MLRPPIVFLFIFVFFSVARLSAQYQSPHLDEIKDFFSVRSGFTFEQLTDKGFISDKFSVDSIPQSLEVLSLARQVAIPFSQQELEAFHDSLIERFKSMKILQLLKSREFAIHDPTGSFSRKLAHELIVEVDFLRTIESEILKVDKSEKKADIAKFAEYLSNNGFFQEAIWLLTKHSQKAQLAKLQQSVAAELQSGKFIPVFSLQNRSKANGLVPYLVFYPKTGSLAVFRPKNFADEFITREAAVTGSYSLANQYQADFVASLVSRFFDWNIVPFADLREDKIIGPGAVQLFIRPGSKDISRYLDIESRVYRSSGEPRDLTEKKFWALDYILSNGDRNKGNIVSSLNGSRYAIDYDYALLGKRAESGYPSPRTPPAEILQEVGITPLKLVQLRNFLNEQEYSISNIFLFNSIATSIDFLSSTRPCPTILSMSRLKNL